MLAELDRLSEKVEIAHVTIVKLREENDALRARCEELRGQLDHFRQAGRAPEEFERVAVELQDVTRQRDEMLRERDEVIRRIRGLLEKVESLEEEH